MLKPRSERPTPANSHASPGRGRRSLRASCAALLAGALALVPIAAFAPAASAVVNPGDPGYVSYSDVGGNEGTTLNFEVRRIGGGGDLTLNYTTGGGNATPGVDYTVTSGQLFFEGGGTNAQVENISVPTLQDNLDEANETFTLSFTDPADGTYSASARGTIRDDDATPTYSLSASANPVSEGAGSVVITATLSAVSGRTVTVPYSTTDGTATDGADYTGSAGNIVIAPGSPSNSVTIGITDDTRDELALETFNVLGGNATPGATNGSPTSLVISIQDNDDQPAVSVGSAGMATEGSALTFPVTLSAASNLTVVIHARTVAGTATSGTDYTAITNQTVTFNPGVTSQNVVVNTTTDTVDEPNETLSVELFNGDNVVAGSLTANGEITDDDDPPSVSLSPTSVNEGSTETTVANTFTATLDAASAKTVTVGYSASGGTATVGEDYVATSGTLTFAPGMTTRTFDLPVVGDLKDEGNGETVNIVLTNGDGTVLAGGALGTNVITITDDDAKPSYSVSNVSQIEGDSLTTNKQVKVVLSNPSAQDIDFDVLYNDDTAISTGSAATGGADYIAGAATLTVPAGATEAYVTTQITGDTVYEGNNQFKVDFTRQSGENDATGGPYTSTVTITNDDTAPVVALSNVSALEGTNAVVKATVTGVSEIPIGIAITSAAGSVLGSNPAETADFTNPGSQPLAISAGTSSGTEYTTAYTIPFLDDLIDETDETVLVTATVVGGAATASGSTATIQDALDDTAPELRVSNLTVGEGVGTANVPVTLTFTGAATSTERTVTADYYTDAVNATAAAGQDYTATTGSLTFLPGQTTKNATVAIIDDSIDEPNQTFSVKVRDVLPSAIFVADDTGTVTITDNDNTPGSTVAVTLGSPTASEASPYVSVPVTLTFPGSASSTETPVTINYTTTPGTALAGQDYTATTSSVTFAPGETSKSIAIPLLNDTIDEPNQTFSITITSTSPSDVSQLGGGIVTVTDDDAAPTLSVGDVSHIEDAVSVDVPVTLSLPVGVTGTEQVVTANYGTLAGSATAGSDYTTATGSLTFNPGETIKLVPVALLEDTVDETDEAFTLKLTGPAPVGVTLTDDSGSVLIADDDASPTISLGDVTVSENDPTATVVATLGFVSGTTATQRTVTVNYTTENGSATAGADYTASTGSVVFAPGQLTKNIVVGIINDTVDEPTEAFTVKVSSVDPVDVTVADNSGSVILNDNDNVNGDALRLDLDDISVAENVSAGYVSLPIALQFPNGATSTQRTVVANYTTTAGTATAGSDYTTTTGSVTFAPGQSLKTVTVPILQDTANEGNENFTFAVTSATPSDVNIQGASALVTITDDDSAGEVRISNTSLDEESATATLTVSLTPAQGTTGTQSTVMVNYTTVNGSALANSDYLPTSGSVSFAFGETSKTIQVSVLEDTIDEPNQAFTVHLSSVTPSDVTLADDTGDVVIVDDDASPRVSLSDTNVNESDPTATVVATLNFVDGTTATEKTVVVPYATQNGSATAGSDYVSKTGSVTFTPGVVTQNIVVTLLPDSVDEPTQAFTVKTGLITPGDVTASDDTGSVIIADDDNLGSLALVLGNVTVAEGVVGGTASVPVTLTFAGGATSTERTVTAQYSTLPSSATANADYTPVTGSLTFAPGETAKTITVPIVNDAVDEADQTFKVEITSATPINEVDLDDALATVTITDNDASPTLAIADAAPVVEGNVNAPLTVSLVQAPGVSGTEQTITVGYATEAGSAAGNADYATTSGTLSFAPGETSKVVNTAIIEDTIDEPAQAFTVKLLTVSPIGIVKSDDSGSVVITDNDAAPSIAIGDLTVVETVGTALVPVTRTLAPNTTGTEQTLTANYVLVADSARAGQDYAAATGSVSFAPNESVKNVSVAILNDTVDESDQVFRVRLSGLAPVDAGLADDTGVVTITDNDAARKPTIDAPESRSDAGPVEITGTTGEGVAVELYAIRFGSNTPELVGGTTSDNEGRYSVGSTIAKATIFGVTAAGIDSDAIGVRVVDAPQLVTSSPSKNTVRARVNTRPNLAGERVVVYRILGDTGRLQVLADGKTDGAGNYSAVIKGLPSGARNLVAYVYGNFDKTGVNSSYSNEDRVQVR